MAATPDNTPSLQTGISGEVDLPNSMPSTKIELSLRLPAVELIRLAQTIKHSIHHACPVVQFVSAYRSEGVNLIAFETALVAATQMGLRVLYIDTVAVSTRPAKRWRKQSDRQRLAAALDLPLGAALQSITVLPRTQVAVSGTSLVYTTLRGPGFDGSTLASLASFQTILEHFRTVYDLIVIPSPAVNADALGLAMANVADGSILVIEAERTRSPVVRQAQRMIEGQGGHVIGAILNKRRFYIPRWLYGSH